MSVPSKKRVLDSKKKVEAESSSDDSSSDEDDYKGGEVRSLKSEN